tara:strand:- start:5733 stop:6632 length:900 start_codon:yes stop_codon:yes gene_type:complete
MKKVVITGCNGLLGQTLINVLLKSPEIYEVFGLSKGDNRSEIKDFSYHNIDITEFNELEKCLKKIKPDAIINSAAMTNVDVCEDQQELCLKVNVKAVEFLVKLSFELKIHLIHISTDFIFDGFKGFYKETDQPNPLNFYGESKLKSEQILSKSSIEYSILRTILVYGKVNNLGRNNIVLWVKEMLENNKEITIVDDQFRMPTYVVDLATACIMCMDKKLYGIFNISSKQLLSIFEIAQQVADVFGLKKELIKPISSKILNQKALRPSKTGFDLSKTIRDLEFYPNSFLKDLKRFKKTLT